MSSSKVSQEIIDRFWRQTINPSPTPTKATAVLPPNVYAQIVERAVHQGSNSAEPVLASYERARKACEEKVTKIVSECRQVNQKYTDPYFILSIDNPDDTLNSLRAAPGTSLKPHSTLDFEVLAQDKDLPRGTLHLYNTVDDPAPHQPRSVQRVTDIFEKPSFFVDGTDAKDIRQGSEGDCWFLSALAALCNEHGTQNLVEKTCVKFDEEVGVYGFVLYRDGDWTSVVIDDKLYLTMADFEHCDRDTRQLWEYNRERIDSAEEYRKDFQTNSRALYFARSTDPNETWVPLIEKAFAKAHGDYRAISGGSVGEGVEDLTGGVSSDISPANILDKNKFWAELLKVNREFLFGCDTPWWDDNHAGRDGLYGAHAYSILKAIEYKSQRLCLLKNPWGHTEWNGPWSDGSSEWNSQSIKDLNHTFGDDGVFWIPYDHLLKKYEIIHRTRLFSDGWTVVQQWASLAIPWAGDYQDAYFVVDIAKNTHTVIVLTQLNERYFRGLQGQYSFVLAFRIHRAGEKDYMARTFDCDDKRSVNVELDLEAGKYEVRLKITATRNESLPKVEDVIKHNWLDHREKLLRVGLSYDLAHAKAQANRKRTVETKQLTNGNVGNGITSKHAKPVPTSDTLPDGGQKSQPLQNSTETLDTRCGDKSNIDEQISQPVSPIETDESDDAWAAVCVVGLRVYCQQSEATIVMITPNKEAMATKLDVDDPASDAAQIDKSKESKNLTSFESQAEGSSGGDTATSTAAQVDISKDVLAGESIAAQVDASRGTEPSTTVATDPDDSEETNGTKRLETKIDNQERVINELSATMKIIQDQLAKLMERG